MHHTLILIAAKQSAELLNTSPPPPVKNGIIFCNSWQTPVNCNSGPILFIWRKNNREKSKKLTILKDDCLHFNNYNNFVVEVEVEVEGETLSSKTILLLLGVIV